MKMKTRLHRAILWLWAASAYSGFAIAHQSADPQFSIRSPGKTLTLSRSQLLKRSDLEKIVLFDTPTYPKQRIEFWAVPVFHLFEGIKLDPEGTIEFRCLDGFSAPISPSRLLEHTPGRSVAYLAIEKESTPWPAVHPEKSPETAGPFFVIWKNPELSHIGVEEWPFQITEFEVKGSLRSSFPKIFPPERFKEQSQEVRGFHTFQKWCFSCHKINQQGLSDFGPDLNWPKSPTEYFNEKALKEYIRNPQSLRHWKNDRMRGFSPDELPDAELTDLIKYLKAMAASRR